jgi:hypothetical protein
LIVFEHVGDGILKEDHPSDKAFDVELIRDLFAALLNVIHKLPFAIGFEPLHESIKIILGETQNVDGPFRRLFELFVSLSLFVIFENMDRQGDFVGEARVRVHDKHPRHDCSY